MLLDVHQKMESEIEHLNVGGNLSADFLWKLKNAFRSISSDAEWSERCILLLPDRMIEDAKGKGIFRNFLVASLFSIPLTVVWLPIWSLCMTQVAMPILAFLLSVTGKEEGFSFTGLIAMLICVSIATVLSYYLLKIPSLFFLGGFRLKAYTKKRQKLITDLISDGIGEFGGARFEKELANAIDSLGGRSGKVIIFLRELQKTLQDGHIIHNSKDNQESNFYSKGFKERIGGVFAISTLWLVAILVIVSIVSGSLWLLWTKLAQ
jgi:heme/copper-type cytochrome/quinol oxidase subunit 4